MAGIEDLRLFFARAAFRSLYLPLIMRLIWRSDDLWLGESVTDKAFMGISIEVDFDRA